MTSTRFPELSYQKTADCWRIVDSETGSVTGPQYQTRAELLADLQRFAAEYGCAGAAKRNPPVLNGATVYASDDGTLFIMLPPDARHPIACSCDDCAHDPVGWNALAVHPDKPYAWNVHLPESAIVNGLKTGKLRR